jgi:hypothetical protein
MPDTSTQYVYKIVHCDEGEDGSSGHKWRDDDRSDLYFSRSDETIAYKVSMNGLHHSHQKIIVVPISLNVDGSAEARAYRATIISSMSSVQRYAVGM